MSVTLADGTAVTYVNDPNGRRIAKLVDGTVVEKYLWSGLTTLLAVYDGSDNLVQRFEYADGRMPVAMTMGGSTYYPAYDQVGTLRLVSDSSGNVVKRIDYDTFGNILSDSNPAFTVPFGFAGGLHDRDTGLVRFGYRDYMPEIGKWTAKDPILFAGGDSNLYGYTGNDPVNFIDPDGLQTSEAAKADAIEPAMAPWEVIMTIAVPAKIGLNLLKQGGKTVCKKTFKTVIDEGGSKLVNVQTKKGKNLEVMFDEVVDGDVLILRKTHIEGAKPGEVGVAELKNIAREYGRERGFKQVVIEGGKRSTGRMKGKTPRPMVIDVD